MEEAAVVVTAATGALGPVVTKLYTLARRRGEYKLRWRTRKDVKRIRSKLKSIHSILWAIWEREDLDTDGKELRMEAWRLADDMNDAIDDFILSMKRSNDGKRFIQAKNQPSPFQDLKRRAVDVCERCRNKWKKMETAQTTIVSSLFSCTKATVDSGPAKRPRVDWYVHKDISELVDMKKPRDKLIKHLVGEEESTPQLKMASIHGAAGTGKTTLARLVYEAIEDKFQARAILSITSYHNMTEVLTSILRQLAPDSPAAGTKGATKNEHLSDIISTFLKDKRYLLIIDDIWHIGEWETMKKSLPDNNLGSRIVTTSRVNAITERWRDDFDALVHKIDHSNYWFRQALTKMIAMKPDMVEESFDCDHHIVEMCDGMPLAGACMISALAKEREHQQRQGQCVKRTPDLQDRILEQVKGNGIQNTPGFEPLVESFELGYNHLPHHMLKICLLYCSIYPEDHKFRRDDLVIRWIAEGFVSKEEAAKDCFDELVSRGFLRGFPEHCEMHPMMHNYLRRKSREYNFITCTSDGVLTSPVGRLCIDKWPSSDALDPLSGIDWHCIRSLVVFEDAVRVPYKHLEHLRVLDVQPNRRALKNYLVKNICGMRVYDASSQALENQHVKDICGLRRLRHLFVSGPRELRAGEILTFPSGGKGITEIPTEIVRLQYLETLQVTETKITRLPAEIGDLKQLKTLDVSRNEKLAELPMETRNLQHILETLRIHTANLREEAWEIIRTLKKLKNLDVSDNSELSGLPRDIGELQQLKTLKLSGTRITELPREIGNLRDLEALDYLSFGQVRNIPKEIVGLKKLKNINVHLSGLPFEAVHHFKREGLPKCVLQAWKNSDLMSTLAGEILSFKRTDVFSGGDGGLIVGTMHMHIPKWIKEHFTNIYYLDIRICTLEEPDLKILREMPSLWDLKLRFEAVPRKPVAISSGGFAKLEFLTVDSRVPRVTFHEGAMPRLLGLRFEFQFCGGPPNADLPMGIKHLVRLNEVTFKCNKWYRADSPCISATIDVMRKEAREHPSKITLYVQGKDKEIFRENSITQSSQDRNEACSSSGAQPRKRPRKFRTKAVKTEAAVGAEVIEEIQA